MKTLQNKMVHSIAAVGISMAAGLIHAEIHAEGVIVRQVLKDGTVLYTDHPALGVKIDARIIVPASLAGRPWMADPGMDGRAPGKSRIVSQPDGAAMPASQQPRANKEAQPNREEAISQAQTLLDSALLAKQHGAEAQLGERTGTVNHTSRLNERFDVRQEKLDRDITAARQALESAYETRQ